MAFVLQPTDYMIGPAAGNPSLCLCWPKASPPNANGIDWQLGKANYHPLSLMVVTTLRNAFFAYCLLYLEVSGASLVFNSLTLIRTATGLITSSLH